jgi:hypothetical protein
VEEELEEGIRFTGLLLGRDRRTGLVFLECGVDGTSTSTPRMLHVLLVRVVALNAATAIALLLLLLPHSLFKKNLNPHKNQLSHISKPKTKTTSRKSPKIPPYKSTTKIHTNSLTLSHSHTKKETRDLHITPELQTKERTALYNRKKTFKDTRRGERDVSKSTAPAPPKLPDANQKLECAFPKHTSTKTHNTHTRARRSGAHEQQ